MQKLVDALETKIAEYREVMDSGPEGLDAHYQGIVVGLEHARDLVLDMQGAIAASVANSILENLIGMKGQVIEALELDLLDAVENDRRMQESVIAEKLGQLRIEKKALEGALVPEAVND